MCMCKRALILACFALLWATTAFPQGLDTPANKDSWEEINFEFDSSVLVDGFPSLLRLAELLSQHADYRVTLEGHADYRGTDQYNTRLSEARAETVKAFLVKYGARDAQVVTAPRGKTSPRVPERTPEALFMNRRVVITLADGQGSTISAGSVGQAISAIEEATKKQEDCCNRIMSELSKLDSLYADLRKRGLAVYAINVDDPSTVSQVGTWVSREGYRFPVLLDSESEILARYHPRKEIPFYVVLDGDARVVENHPGYTPGDIDALRTRLEQALPE